MEGIIAVTNGGGFSLKLNAKAAPLLFYHQILLIT